MSRNKDNEFKNAQCSGNNDFKDSKDNNLRNHNEKRKAQDSSNNELNDSKKINKLD